MYYCKKCGKEIKENDKFCTVCGTPNTFDNKELYTEENNDDISENEQVKPSKNKSKKKSKLTIILLILAILIVGIAGGIVFMKETAIQKEKLKQTIEIVSVDAENYPNIVVSIKAENYPKSLDAKSFTIKENDIFQKDLKLSEALEGNEYKISYKTSDETASGERNIKVACLDGESEAVAELLRTDFVESMNTGLVPLNKKTLSEETMKLRRSLGFTGNTIFVASSSFV